MAVKSLTPPGQMVDVGGFRLHAIVRGQGSPTVVLESGLGGCALQFGPLQMALSAFTRVVAYDRAGQAWSDPSPNPRTPEHIAAELMTLLQKLDIQPPYIWAGHSFGGLLARMYAGMYPADTAGVVVLDSSDVDQYETFPSMDKAVSQLANGMRLLKFLGRLGLGKQLTKMSLGPALKSLPKADLDAFLTATSQPGHQDTILAEFSQHRYYFGPTSEVPRSLGDTPFLIVTAGSSVSGKSKFGGMTADELNVKHQEWQRELLGVSSQAQHVVVKGASHLSLIMQPEYVAQVVDPIRRMVAGARSAHHENEMPMLK